MSAIQPVFETTSNNSSILNLFISLFSSLIDYISKGIFGIKTKVLTGKTPEQHAELLKAKRTELEKKVEGLNNEIEKEQKEGDKHKEKIQRKCIAEGRPDVDEELEKKWLNSEKKIHELQKERRRYRKSLGYVEFQPIEDVVDPLEKECVELALNSGIYRTHKNPKVDQFFKKRDRLLMEQEKLIQNSTGKLLEQNGDTANLSSSKELFESIKAKKEEEEDQDEEAVGGEKDDYITKKQKEFRAELMKMLEEQQKAQIDQEQQQQLERRKRQYDHSGIVTTNTDSSSNVILEVDEEEEDEIEQINHS